MRIFFNAKKGVEILFTRDVFSKNRVFELLALPFLAFQDVVN